MTKIPLKQIAPRRCNRPDDVRAVRGYAAMLRKGKTVPAVWIVPQSGKRYRYWILDGECQVRAARLAGHTTIEAIITDAVSGYRACLRARENVTPA